MATSVARLDQRLITAPGATSDVSNSVTLTAGRYYLAVVHQFRQASTDPAPATLTGPGTPSSWTKLATPNVAGGLWSSTGTTRRRAELFELNCVTGGTGTLTATWGTGNQPADACIIVLEFDTATGIAQIVDGTGVANNATLWEPFTLAVPGSTDNRFVAFFVGNTNASATARLEVGGDAGAEANWTTFSPVLGSAAAPVGFYGAGYLSADPNTDRTPGLLVSSGNSPTSYMIGVEVVTAPSNPNPGAYFGIAARTGGPLPTSGLGISALGTTPLGG